MLNFTLKHPLATQEMLGYLPSFWSESDPRNAREKADSAYRHGGGWSEFNGFKMLERGLQYPGDPIMPLLAEAKLREEIIRFYQSAWVAIVQPDGSYEVSRMD